MGPEASRPCVWLRLGDRVILSITTACLLREVFAALDRIFRQAQDAGASPARCSGHDDTECVISSLSKDDLSKDDLSRGEKDPANSMIQRVRL